MSQRDHDILLSRVAGGQIQGGRDYQEDNFRVLDLSESDNSPKDDLEAGPREGNAELDLLDRALLILTDGMGGHVGGAKASHIAAAEFALEFERQDPDGDPHDALMASLNAANDAIADAVEEDPGLDGMGTTMIAAYVSGTNMYWCSVGDSLFYIWRNGALQRLNADHSMVPILNRMVEVGELTQGQADKDSRRHALRSALDGSEINLWDVSETPYFLQTNDLLLLASDGLETLKENEITKLLAQDIAASPTMKIDRILNAVMAVNRPDQDNATVLLYDLQQRSTMKSHAITNFTPNDMEDTKLRPERQTGSRNPGKALPKDDLPSPRTWSPAVLGLLGFTIVALFVATFWFLQTDRSETPSLETTPVMAEVPAEPDVDLSLAQSSEEEPTAAIDPSEPDPSSETKLDR